MAKDKIIKIAVIGAESTGKSTLCADLALHYSTIFVKEYARTYFNKNDIESYTLKDLEKIYKQQIKNETAALKKAKRFLFCDTTLITGKIWAEEKFNTTSQFISETIDKVNYDLYLLTKNDIPWKVDKQRKNKHDRTRIFNKNLQELKALKTPYIIISGLHFTRSLNAIKSINKFFNTKKNKQ